MPIFKTVRYYIAKNLRKLANSFDKPSEKEKLKKICFEAKKEVGNQKKAAIFYIFQSVYLLKQNQWEENKLNSHTMYWESVEMVKLLLKNGYSVDYFDCLQEQKNIDWGKYDLIIDERNNLGKCTNADAVKLYYATGCHWLMHNLAEYNRIAEFKNRNSILLEPQRQIESYDSDIFSDYITYFGNHLQRKTYEHCSAKMIPLNLSATHFPGKISRNIKSSKYNFLWIGSRGAVHKGLDIVVEAFCLKPNFNLFIAGAFKSESQFMLWLNKRMEQYSNIHFKGWMDIESKEFYDLAADCLGTIYTSAAEGGAGAVIQLMHFGIIPFVNATTALRAEEMAIKIAGNEPLEQIDSIKSRLDYFVNLEESELTKKSENIRKYALENHSRSSFSKSFENFIKILDETD